MEKETLTEALKAAVENAGGSLDNGWSVEVKTRPTGNTCRVAHEKGRMRGVRFCQSLVSGLLNYVKTHRANK